MTASPSFALATVSAAGGAPFAAMVLDGRAIALTALVSPDAPISGAESVLAVLQDWEGNFPRLETAAGRFRGGAEAARLQAMSAPVESLRMHPPVNLPRQVLCTGANYRKHVIDLIVGDPSQRGVGNDETDPAALRRQAEAIMDQRADNATPYCFIKLPTAMVGADDEVILPPDVKKPDWELELAVVIGRRCRHVTAAEAMSYVAGYAIINDVTARDLTFRPDIPAMATDWLSGKNAPTFAPFGPYLVPAAFVPDPYALNIRLSVNGKVMQDESTADMMIRIDRQIEYLSNRVELMPGDVIATGSPAGNGSHHGVFLKAGDLMEGAITGLGQQRIRCVDEA